ncbi:MAG: TonB-dependent receptor [Pseudomonadota bacterium]
MKLSPWSVALVLIPSLSVLAQDAPAPVEPMPPVAETPAAEVPAQPPAPEPATIAVEAAPAAAVESPSPEPQARQIQEVTVTAQKTEQSLQEVPISITALGGEFIQDTGASGLADVSLYVPNARIDADDPGSPQVFIRGFGTNSFNPSFESSVGLVQDEIYFGRPGYFTEALFDIDRVEILRGPQGTLFGKNTIAGVFNVISKGVRDSLEADGRIFYGEHNEQRLEGGAGGMFNDWVGARASVLYRKTDGQLFNTLTERDEEQQTQKAARLKLKLGASERISTEITGVTSRTEAPFWPFQLFKLDDDTRTYLESFDSKVEDDPTNFITSYDTVGYIEKGSDTIGAKTEWRVGDLGPFKDLTPVLVLGGSRFHIDQLNELDVSPADIARLDSHERHRQTSAELRFSTQADSLFGLGEGVEVVAGGFYFDSEYSLFARVLAGADIGSYLLTCDFQILAGAAADNSECVSAGPGLPQIGPITASLADGDTYQFDYDQSVRSKALFGQFTWNLTERWAITPGVRVNQEQKVVNTKGASHCQTKDAGLPTPCILENILMSMDYDLRDLRRDEMDVSPKFALQYFGDSINYYASYARGFKSGGFNSISLGRACDDPDDPTSCRVVTSDDLEYEPETAETYEVGAKGKFLDDSLAVNLTLYQTKFENLQVLAFNGVFFDVSNAGAATSSGLEADFQWLTPYEPLTIIGSLGLLDAKYDRYASAPAPISQGVNQKQDLAGQRIAFAPSGTATLTPMLSYDFGLFRAKAAADILYQGDQFTDTDLDPNSFVDSYIKYSARITLSSPDEQLSLTLGGTNLSDQRVLNQVTDATFFPGTYFAQQAPGRQLFATLSFRL